MYIVKMRDVKHHIFRHNKNLYKHLSSTSVLFNPFRLSNVYLLSSKKNFKNCQSLCYVCKVVAQVQRKKERQYLSRVFCIQKLAISWRNVGFSRIIYAHAKIFSMILQKKEPDLPINFIGSSFVEQIEIK